MLSPEGGSPPASLSGRTPPLIPPYQGGKKLSPFGVALLPCREWKRLPFGRVRPEGRFVAVVPLIRGSTPKGGGGFVCSGEPPCFPVGNENGPPSGCYPLIPPYQGGKKLSPFGVALLPYREVTPPYQGGLLPLSP